MSPDVVAPQDSTESLTGHDVFISYAREDQDFVRRLHDALTARGRQPWVDWEGIPPSAEWMREVQAAIDSADSFIFVVSPASAASGVCADEAEHAAAQGKRLIPVVWREAEDDIPESLAARNWIFFRDTDDFDTATESLIRALDTDLDWVREHTRLLVRAKEWERGKDKAFLLRGKELAEAEQWLAAAGRHPENEPTSLHTEYLVRSRQTANRGQRRRLVAVSLALVLSIGSSIFAFFQQRRAEQQAEVADSGRLAALAGEEMTADPELSMLLAIEAIRTSPTVAAEQQLRDTLNYYRVHTVLRHPAGVNSVEYSADGQWLVTGAVDGLVRIYRRGSTEPIHVLRGLAAPVSKAVFSPDGERVTATASDGAVVVWDVSTSDPVLELQQPVGGGSTGSETAFAASVSYSPGGGELLTVGGGSDPSDPGTAVVWDVGTGRRLMSLSGHEQRVNVGEFSPTGDRILTGSSDGSAVIWDAESGKPLQSLEPEGPPGDVGIVSASFDPYRDGEQVVTGVFGAAHVWDARTGQLLTTYHGHEDESVASAEFHPKGLGILTVGNREVTNWGYSTRGSTIPINDFPGHTLFVTSAVYSPDGTEIATSSADGTVRIRASKESETGFQSDGRTAWDLDWAPSGRTIATVGPVGAALWDSGDGRAKGAPALEEYGTSEVHGVDISPDGERLLTTDFQGGTIYDIDAGVVLATLVSPREPEPQFEYAESDGEFSPDGRYVATSAGDATVRVWDADEGELLRTLSGHDREIWELEWSDDSRRIASASADRTARIWDAETGRTMAVLRGHRNEVNAADFSPDGRFVVTASDDQTVRIWDAATGRQVRVLRGHDDGVYFAAYSPDGERIVTGSADRSVRVWEADSGITLDVFRGFFSGVTAAEFSPNGDRIGVLAPFVLQVFTCELCVPLDQLMSLAQRRAARTLTAEERLRYAIESP